MLNMIRQNGSMTAYGPLFGRWVMHKAGMRPDDACERLFRALPSVPPRLLGMMTTPAVAALRVGGLTPRFTRYANRRPSTPSTYIYQRTCFFDAVLRDQLDKVKQVVFLGAGWDTRAFNISAESQPHIFEVDAPETQQIKLAALEKAGIDCGEVRFVSADFNRESWLDALIRHDFDPALPTYFHWEGVTYYLDEAAVHATLDTVATRCASGSAIAFDYPSREIVDGDPALPIRAALKYLEQSGEAWTYGISTAAPARTHVAQLVESRGLQLERFEACGAATRHRIPFGGLALATSRSQTV